jgi:hypothetical protein
VRVTQGRGDPCFRWNCRFYMQMDGWWTEMGHPWARGQEPTQVPPFRVHVRCCKPLALPAAVLSPGFARRRRCSHFVEVGGCCGEERERQLLDVEMRRGCWSCDDRAKS